MESSKDVAVIGMAGRFPGSANLQEFWENLVQGRDCISREDPLAYEENGCRYIKAYGKLDDIFCFDNEFFDIKSSEALQMEPQERLLLQCAYHALQDAGCVPDQYDGKIGIICGTQENEYYYQGRYQSKEQNKVAIESQKFTNSGLALTSRISYKLNLTGPSVIVNTTCATSLTAVHMAAKMLLYGEADVMLAGGTNVSFEQCGYVVIDGMSSTEGKVKAFSNEGSGLVPGNGVGIVVLKRLERAVHDGDHIYAVVKGSAIGNDGSRKIGFTAPSIQGEIETVEEAIKDAGIEKTEIVYIEGHGTATPLGDAIEVRALSKVFKGHVPAKSIPVGSLKSNFGHMNSAAGIAGFIKGVLVLYHNCIPPSIHVNKPNSEFKEDAPVYVCDSLLRLDESSANKKAGISSFGLGGVNAHVILAEYKNNNRKTVKPLSSFKKHYFNQFSRADDEEKKSITVIDLLESVLGRTGLTAADELYDLGMDSLTMVIMKSKIQETFGCTVTIQDIQKCITIEDLKKTVMQSIDKTAVYTEKEMKGEESNKSIVDLINIIHGRRK